MARRLKLSLQVEQPDDGDDHDDDGGGDEGGYDDGDDDEKNVGTRMDEMIICGSLFVLVYNEVLISDQDSCIDCNSTCPPTRDSSSSKAI